jgi:hypothetical protein
MADKKISELNGGVAVTPADGDWAIIETVAGNSRPTNFGLMADLLDGKTERRLASPGANMGGLRIVTSEFTPNLSAGSVTISAAIPAGALVLGVTTFVNALLTGSLTSFDVGTVASPSLFGNYIGVSASTLNIAQISPLPIAAATDIVLTANGGSGASNAGKIRVVAYYLLWETPTI